VQGVCTVHCFAGLVVRVPARNGIPRDDRHHTLLRTFVVAIIVVAVTVVAASVVAVSIVAVSIVAVSIVATTQHAATACPPSFRDSRPSVVC